MTKLEIVELIEYAMCNPDDASPEGIAQEIEDLFEPQRKCARCGANRTDNIDSDICGRCADDLRMDNEAYEIAENMESYWANLNAGSAK